MNLAFTPTGWDDFEYWQDTDQRMVKRIRRLLQATVRTPTEGIGKPERLKHVLENCWSRRIDQEHRLVYQIRSDAIVVLACRYYYGNVP